MGASRKWLFFVFFAGACATEALPPEENHAPVANGGPDQTTRVGETVELDGSNSQDADGDVLAFRWSLMAPEGSTAMLANTNYVTTSFAPDVPGEYRVQLVANDGKVDSSPDTITITVGGGTNVNMPPIAVLAAPPNVEVGTPVSLDGTESSDPDGDGLFFDWLLEGGPPGTTAQLDDPYSPTPTFTPDLVGDYEVSLVVSDGTSDSTPVSVVISAVPPPNVAPIADAGRDVATATGTDVQLDGTGSVDPEGETLSYVWSLLSSPAGSMAALSASDVAQPTLTTDVDGDYTIQLVVSDGEAESQPDTVVVTAVTGNVPPNANAGEDQTVEVGEVVQLTGAASTDNEGDTLSYTWTITGRPVGSTVQLSNASAEAPSFTPDEIGDFEIQLVVNDGTADSAPDVVRVTVVSPNTSPTADAGLDQEGRVLSTVSLDGSDSVDLDGDVLSYSWAFAFQPASSTATIDNRTSVVASFEPDVAGTYTVALTVNDGLAQAVDMMTVTVLDPMPQIEGDVVITEVMADPDVLGDSVGEWFEIHNPTNTTWNLKDCDLTDLDTDYALLDGSLVVRPGAYVTLARSANPGFGPDFVYSGYSLGNSGDEILINCAGTEVAQVPLLTAFGFPSSAPTGASLGLLRSSLDEVANDDGANWCQSTSDYNGDKGTPGAPNEYQNQCP